MRLRTLPTIKSKESALRQQVKQTKREVDLLEEKLEQELRGYQGMVSLWDEFDASLITVDRVDLSMKKIAGVLLPVLDGILVSRDLHFLKEVHLLSSLLACMLEVLHL